MSNTSGTFQHITADVQVAQCRALQVLGLQVRGSSPGKRPSLASMSDGGDIEAFFGLRTPPSTLRPKRVSMSDGGDIEALFGDISFLVAV